jgi:hypothetical protein
VTPPRDLDALRQGAEAFLEEIAREVHAAHAGWQADADLQGIYSRHADAVGPEALAVARAAWEAEAPGAAALLEWLVGEQVDRALAPLHEAVIRWEATAAADVGGRRVAYQALPIEIANATERTERLALDRARAALVAAELAPRKREVLEREHAIVAALGIGDGYVATWEALTGIALAPLAAECATFLRDTQALWDEERPRALRAAGIPVADATRADAATLFRARGFDHGFPPAALEPAVRRHVTEMGLSPDADGRVRYDTGEREGKRSRAFCAPVAVPSVVHLVCRPHGGVYDWTTLLHELGHALHFASMDAARPVEARWLGDNSVTEGFAMLFDHRLQAPGWVARYTELRRKDRGAFRRVMALEELHFLRRYCGKLAFELALHGGAVAWDALPALYVETLSTATGFRYDPADAFVDVDARFYCVRYLRAWQLQARIDQALTERCDEDWWRNPRAGPWLRDTLMAPGQAERADQLAGRLAAGPLDFTPVRAAIEAAFG